jgi:hypothetical protein
MTQLTIPGVVNRTYTFSATQNDGRITQMADAISGETIDYQYLVVCGEQINHYPARRGLA